MSVLGIDIGSKFTKIVELEKRGANWAVLSAGVSASPASIESAGQQEIILIAQVLKKLLVDTKAVAKDANMSLPEDKVFTRLLKLPYLTDNEVESAIAWQAEQYIPIPIAEAILDYQIIKRNPPQDAKPGSVEVLLLAAPKALVKKYTDIATLVGLSVVSVETEMLALARSLAPEVGTVIIADFGASTTSLGIVRNSQLVISYSVATGGEVLTRAVATGLGLALAQAEEYKKAYGLDTRRAEGKVAGVLVPIFKVFVDEVKKAIRYYKTEAGGQEQISTLILAGGTAGMPEIVPFIASALGVEVLVPDPFAKIIKDPKTSKNLAAYFPLYGVAVGLARE